MTHPELVAKKLAFVTTCVRERGPHGHENVSVVQEIVEHKSTTSCSSPRGLAPA